MRIFFEFLKTKLLIINRLQVFKILIPASCLVCLCGCQSDENYTVHEEYIEKKEWDAEMGWNESFKAKWTMQWEN